MSKSEPPKIMFYIGNLAIGGAQRVVVNLANYFNSLHYPVVIVTAKVEDGEYTYDEGVGRIHSDIVGDEITDSGLQNFIRRLTKMRRIWKKERPSVILSFMGKSNFMSIVSAFGLGIPVLVSVRSDPNREYAGKIMRFLSKTLFYFAAGIVLQTEDAVQYFPKCIRKKAIIMPNSLKPDFIKPRFEGVRRNEIVTVGAIDANKNHALLIDAFAEIANEYPQMQVILYGEGCKRRELEERVKKLNLSEKIHFPGRDTAIYDKIDQARIFVLTSNAEGMPNALMEAMALGLAVISTDCPCGGPRTLIKDGENGLLIPVGDKQALTQALRRILQNPGLEEKLGKNAHKLGNELKPDKVNEKWRIYIEGKVK